MTTNRRQFLGTITSLGRAAVLATLPENASILPSSLPIGCNAYTWYTFFGRDNKDFYADFDASFTEYVKAGFTTIEPSFSTVEEVNRMIPFLKKYKVAIPSAYVGCVMHQADEAAKSIQTSLAIADILRPLGTKIIVNNPSPIGWGSPENKTDAELIEQAKNLDNLGAALCQKGMTLAYHTHDSEMRAGAREFHHVFQATSPKNVKFCFDVHWIYRGSGNSKIAVFDVLKMYGKRIVELHIRQSVNGVWSEIFGDGDIDYRRLAQELKAIGVRPHLVLEQCIEDKSPKTVDVVEASRKGIAYAKAVFAPILL
jgi:inosose dehydratase